jgi:hypothetical protein
MSAALPNEVFLSHSNHDRDFADSLAEVMRGHGIPVWYSQTSIIGAQQWHDEIGAALRRCDWLAVVLSTQSIESVWVKRELLYALRQNLRFENKIIPIIYEACDYERLSWTLSAFQIVDFTRTFAEGCADLLRIWGLGYRDRDLNQRENRPMTIKKPNTEEPHSVNQSMVNSPGGIQAGRDVNIHQATQPRRLTAEQSTRLIETLSRIPQKGNIIIECFADVPDSCAFAVDFRKAFAAAGFGYDFKQTANRDPLPPKGLFLAVRSLEDAPPFATFVLQALNSIGLTVEGLVGGPYEVVVSAGVKAHTAAIIVGAPR